MMLYIYKNNFSRITYLKNSEKFFDEKYLLFYIAKYYNNLITQ